MALWILFLLTFGFGTGLSAKIAGFIAFGGSQYINMRNILEELASRGHEVNLLLMHQCLHLNIFIHIIMMTLQLTVQGAKAGMPMKTLTLSLILSAPEGLNIELNMKNKRALA